AEFERGALLSMGLTGFEPTELAAAFAVPMGADDEGTDEGERRFDADGEERGAEREAEYAHVRRAERARRVARLARRIYDRIPGNDPTKFPTVETLAQELSDEQLPGESASDWLGIIKEAAAASGRFEKTAPRGSASVQNDLEMALAINGGSLNDAEAEQAA